MEVWGGVSARAASAGEPPSADKGLTRLTEGLAFTRLVFHMIVIKAAFYVITLFVVELCLFLLLCLYFQLCQEFLYQVGRRGAGRRGQPGPAHRRRGTLLQTF